MEINVTGEELWDNTTQSGCQLFGGDQTLCDAIVITKRVMSCLSLIGSIFSFCLAVLFRKYFTFSQRLILNLNICALFSSISFIMQADNHYKPGHFCAFKGWFVTFMDWTVLLWVWSITFNLAIRTIKNIKTDKFEWVYHVVCWVVSMFVSCLPFHQQHYRNAELWCWIGGDNSHAWRFGIWYVPLIVSVILLFIIYPFIFVTIKKQIQTYKGHYDPDLEQRKKLMQEDIKPLRWYPFVYLGVSLFAIINRIQNAFGDPIFALMILHVLTSPLQGFCNAVVFCLDPATYTRLNPDQLKMAALQWWYQRREPLREYLEEKAPEPTAASPQDVQMEQIAGTVNPGFDIGP